MEVFDRINSINNSKDYITSSDDLWNELYDYIDYIERFKTYTKKNWSITLDHVIKYFPQILESVMIL